MKRTLLLWGNLLLLLTFLSHCSASAGKPNSTTSTFQGKQGWIVSASDAKKLHSQGALFLDVRKKSQWLKQHVKGSQHTTWQHFSQTKAPNLGKLKTDKNILQLYLRALGVSNSRALVIVGDPVGGWGEDGRFVWMLRTLGHNKVSLVDGGHNALASAGLPMSTTASKAKQGDFTIKRNAVWEIEKDNLRKSLQQKSKPTLIDTRELREYKGATPYGESRGGHVPNAIHLYYKDLITSKGLLLTRKQLLEKLKKKGITPDKAAVAYCTGGVRSAWFVVVLYELGFKSIKNYAGSMWEWSAGSKTLYPLKK